MKNRALAVTALLMTLLVSGNAFAQEEKKQDWQSKINEATETYLVTPVALVFFWDMVFWDNDTAYMVRVAPSDVERAVALFPKNATLVDAAAGRFVVNQNAFDTQTIIKRAGIGILKIDPRDVQLPILVVWLVIGATFFTIRMGFINVRAFGHAIKVVRGKYDNPKDAGEVTHFQALASALSATIGLGNIAGVAIAVSLGGPGATFWMVLAGFLGMSSKFIECTLGQKFREVRPDGRIMGGAMYYLSNGLKEKLGDGFGATFGRVLAVMFAVLCIGGSIGGGNAFQVNQSLKAIEQTIPWLATHGWVYGVIMTVLVGVVIIGGIRRIAATAEKIVPTMCVLYVLACMYILVLNAGQLGSAFSAIFAGAFSSDAMYGGLIGVLIMGFKRAAFSNEAGVGSAAIAHSAAKTDYPIREGTVAMLGPFIDTVVICTMTALVIVITGAYDNPDPAYIAMVEGNEGAALTSVAMRQVVSWFPYVLSVAVVLFAYSTMISWSYYGERCWSYLFGDKASLYYRLLFLVFVFLGSVVSAKAILDLSDLMILGMAFPNILGLYFLAGSVRKDMKVYMGKLKAGELKMYK